MQEQVVKLAKLASGQPTIFTFSAVNKMATKYEIERFKGSNFSLWKMKIKAILRKDNCLAAIGDRPAEITDDVKWNEMDGNVIANIHLALADEVLSSVAEKKTAKEI